MSFPNLSFFYFFDATLKRERVTYFYRANKDYKTNIHFSIKSLQASDVIEELEQRVSELKQQLQESEHQRQQQLRVSPEFFTQEK